MSLFNRTLYIVTIEVLSTDDKALWNREIVGIFRKRKAEKVCKAITLKMKEYRLCYLPEGFPDTSKWTPGDWSDFEKHKKGANFDECMIIECKINQIIE